MVPAAVVLPDKHLVSVKPAAILRCAMASAIADWIRTDMAPLAANLGSVISDLDNFDSFDCRGRNGVTGAKLSEHGRANALDVRGLKLANGQSISLTDRTVSRELRESVLHSVCARFSTVLGPGSDGYHEEHIHLDLMERHNNYKICQWNVWDPLPQIAPLLPLERPEEAPPREVAAKSDATKSDAAKSDAAKSNAAKPDAAKPNAAKSDATKSDAKSHAKSDAAEPRSGETRPPTKKRRENRRSLSRRDVCVIDHSDRLSRKPRLLPRLLVRVAAALQRHLRIERRVAVLGLKHHDDRAHLP